jgi:chromosome segregation ATPase
MILRWLAGAWLLLVALATPARTADALPRAEGRAAAAARPSNEDRAFLLQLGEAQQGLSEQLEQLKERIDWLYYEVTLRRDEHTGIDQEVKAMRDEVKGLYVESSTLKEAIDALKDDVGGVNSNVSSFRTFSGLFIALTILLLAVIFAMTIRR